MQTLETVYKSFMVKGGCTSCPSVKPKATYEKLYVSDGSYVSSKRVMTVLSEKSCHRQEAMYCLEPEKLKSLTVECKLTAYSCVIKETYFQIATGEWKACREVIYGRYRGQKMIDVRSMI